MTDRTLPDPSTSRAVLIGVARYPRMSDERQLPAVEQNLTGLAARLADGRIWGLPAAHCVVLRGTADADHVIGALRTAAGEAEDALIFYYAGHGLTDPLGDSELHLALSNAYEPGGTHLALRYPHVRREMRLARAKRKLVLLDCCWSGLAMLGAMSGDDVCAATAIAGTAVLTASAANRKALAAPGERYTAFTGALLALLDEGIAGGPELLDLGLVFDALYRRLGGSDRPLPQLAATGLGAELPFVRNTAWDATATSIGPATAPAPSTVAAAPPSDIQELSRSGRYRDAYAEGLRAAATGETEMVRRLVVSLRRAGRYDDAAQLERAASDPASIARIIQRLPGGSGSCGSGS